MSLISTDDKGILIEVAEKDLQLCESRLDELERKIRLSDLTEAQLQTLQSEERDLNKEKRNLKRLYHDYGKKTGRILS